MNDNTSTPVPGTTPAPAAVPHAGADTRPVLVTGATGTTGRRVAAQLLAAGAPVRAASRNAAARFDWNDAASWPAVLAGVRALYLVPPEPPVAVAPFLELAVASGIEHVVLLSARHPDQDPTGRTRATEEAVRALPVAWTIVRPAWFVQNFTEGLFVPDLDAGWLALPVGAGREPFVDADDIAAVVVAALLGTGDDHRGAVYELSGPEALTFAEAVATVGRAQGRELRFEEVPGDDWSAAARAAGWPGETVELLSCLFGAIAAGANERLSTGVADALGRPPRSFAAAVGAATP